MNNNWNSAYEQFDSVILPKLQKIGKEIGIKAQNGSVESQTIIKYYEMVYRSFDPMTVILLEEAIKKYEALPN